MAAAFGAVLRERRLRAELTQEQLAFEADIQRVYVSGLELGRYQPTLTMLFKLAKALGCAPGELVSEVDTRLASAPQKNKRQPGATATRVKKITTRSN
nr:helix-turn-helix transcriptional regulator [Burkholderia pyrrocinia]